MRKGRKKRKFWIILLIIIVIAGIWFLLSEDDTIEEGGSTSRDEISSILDTSAVREQLVTLKGNGEDTVTVMVYMNGSDLETDDAEATSDLSEMITGAGTSDKVNIVVQTMGTKKWQKDLGIASDRTQRYKLDGKGLTLLQDNLGQLDCTATQTLADFIKWSAANFPADRFILLFWDHGGGSVYGFGYDQWNSDESAALTIDEMQSALKQAGVLFDFIGMDCCIMSTLETACAFYDYCDYSILSEDFESGLGWYYSNWISKLYANTSIATTELGKIIIDDMVKANVNDPSSGDESIMTMIDEGMIKVLYTAWTDFAYQNEKKLTSKNYSRAMKPKHGGRILPSLKTKFFGGYNSGYGYDDYDSDSDDYSLLDYYEVDIMAAASSISSNSSEVLQAAVASTLVHTAYTSGDANLTGIAVTLPYGDSEAYEGMKKIFSNIGMDQKYISWLEQFVTASGASDYYDYRDFDNSWNGWDDYEDDYNWSDWDKTGNDDFWGDDGFGFSEYDYNNSYNKWYDEHEGSYDDDYYYDEEYYGFGDLLLDLLW